jgi:hypothetical protein
MQTQTVISTAAHEYYRRPADERYESPEALLAHARTQKANSREITYNLKDLAIIPAGTNDGTIRLASPKGAADFTPWSHGQFCRLVGAPAGYIRTLPAQIAADALNHGITRTTPGTTAQLLAERKDDGGVTLRAATSESYGRLWDADLYHPIVSTLCQSGWGLPPTWDGKPAGAYRSDRDSFLILTNGGSIVNDPSVRNGNGQMYRGLLVRNSEVGAAAVSIQRILYQFVCGNHNLWGAVIDQQYRRRHVGTRVLYDTVREIGRTAREWTNRAASTDEAIIRSLIDLEIAHTQEAVIDELRKLGATQEDAQNAYRRCVNQFDASPRSYWGLAQGLTAMSQDAGYQDERLTLDQLAAKLLTRGRSKIAVAA